MKQLLIFISFFAFISSSFSQVLIKGKIIDSSNSSVILYEPINGFCNNHLIARPDFLLNINSSGNFEKKLWINSPVVITIMIGRIYPVWLLVESNDTITVEIDPSKFDKFSPKGGIRITGKNAAGNEFYNVFNYNPIKKIKLFENILDSLHFKETLDFNAIDYAFSKIIHPFDSLLAKGAITKSFYAVIVNDTKGVLLESLISFAFFEKKLSLDSAIVFTNNLYTKYPVTKQMMRVGLYAPSISYYYYYSKARKYYSSYLLDDSIFTMNGKKIFVNSNFIHWLYAPKDIQEVQWAMSLIQLKQLFSASFGKRDVEAYLTLFPNSNMKEYLSPPYFKLTETSDRTVDSSAFVFMPSDSLNSFNSVVSSLSGKKVLIDFWATWCIPCKMEFSYNEQVDSFCAKNNIQRLYIAFEIGQTKQNLKKDVIAYNLKGLHIAANKKLIDDITKRFYPGEGGYTIPHYLLINEKGEVVNADASKPSAGNQLFSEMKSAFKLSY